MLDLYGTAVTRRLSGLEKINKEPSEWMVSEWYLDNNGNRQFRFDSAEKYLIVKPRYHPGEMVYVKEGIHRFNGQFASYNLDSTPVMLRGTNSRFLWRWNKDKLSPMFLPCDAARHFLQVNVSLGRLQEITEEDSVAEGCRFLHPYPDYPARKTFHTLWDSINPDYPWGLNPFIFRYELKSVPRPEGI